MSKTEETTPEVAEEVATEQQIGSIDTATESQEHSGAKGSSAWIALLFSVSRALALVLRLGLVGTNFSR